MMNQTGVGNQSAKAFSLMLLAGLLLSACATTNPRPQVIVARSGEVQQYKRTERYLERDFFRHWIRKAYYPAAEVDFDLVEGSQKTVMEEWGRPDFVRGPFESLNGDRVEEWVYFDRQEIFQFINRETVFEGPLTDFEQILIREGRPNECEITLGESGIRHCALVYYNIGLTGRFESYNLANDWLVYSSEGR